MTFNSLSYFFFFPLVYLVYYVTTDRFRWFVLQWETAKNMSTPINCFMIHCTLTDTDRHWLLTIWPEDYAKCGT